MRTFILSTAFLLSGFYGYSAFCNTATNMGTLTPGTTSQNTPTVNAGRPYWTFNATAGCTYTFSTCGLTGVDTYLRLYTGTGGTLIAQNDQACGNQSTIVWTCNNTGTYSILISRYSASFFTENLCNTLNANVQMSYVMDCTLNAQSCLGATQVCDDIAFSGNSSGAGGIELITSTAGCLLGGEHQSSWYYFQPTAAGTVSMAISTAFDYDFAIWTGTCANLGAPVRCSWAATSGNTGMGNGAVDVSEDEYGNKWVAPLNVTMGQTYIMLIDNYTANATSFTLDWTMSNGATLNCSPVVLPVGLISFEGRYNEESMSNFLYWATQSERENDHFTLERSEDGQNWEIINTQKGQEESSELTEYSYTDYTQKQGIVNYYRLSQTDTDGEKQVLGMISVDNTGLERKLIGQYNMLGQEVGEDAKGIIILLYDDGMKKKIIR